MANSPSTICRYPGCNTLVIRGACKAHSKDTRPSRHARGYDHHWTKFRKAYIARHPFCAIRTHCKGDYTYAVDHIVPLRDAPLRKFDETNLQPACQKCHNAKTRAGK